MLPLTFASEGDWVIVRKVSGAAETKKHLEDLGFVAGGSATVVSALGGNLIVKVKESRVAISDHQDQGFLACTRQGNGFADHGFRGMSDKSGRKNRNTIRRNR